MFGALAIKLATWLAGGSLESLVGTIANAYTAKVNAGETHDKLNADLIAREAALAQREAELQAALAMREPYFIRWLFAAPPGLYYCKVYVWDKVFGLGVTDPLSSNLTWVAQTVIISYFGSGVVKDCIAAIRARG